MKNKSHSQKFIKQPGYPGGNKALDEFIKSNLQYPEEALKNNISGAVTVKYDFDVYGKVIKAEIVHGIGYGCDEEAVRIIRLLQYPKKIYRGLHVVFHQFLTINFRLPGSPVPANHPEIVIQYEYTPPQIKTTGDDKITYTITVGK